MKENWLGPRILASFATLLLLGCSADATPKTSHFEHDHIVAPHWPNDLADAATKIRERLAWLQDGPTPALHDHEHHHDHGHDDHHDHGHELNPTAEIVEIVSWIPEIAADTNLCEADWLPIYHATESLVDDLRSASEQSVSGELTSDSRRQLESLCELVDEAVTKIPEQFPHLMKVQS